MQGRGVSRKDCAGARKQQLADAGPKSQVRQSERVCVSLRNEVIARAGWLQAAARDQIVMSEAQIAAQRLGSAAE
jgi:hypothetical protein